MGFPKWSGRLDPQWSGVGNNFSMGLVVARGPPKIVSRKCSLPSISAIRFVPVGEAARTFYAPVPFAALLLPLLREVGGQLQLVGDARGLEFGSTRTWPCNDQCAYCCNVRVSLAPRFAPPMFVEGLFEAMRFRFSRAGFSASRAWPRGKTNY